jgi:hypothetical protein
MADPGPDAMFGTRATAARLARRRSADLRRALFEQRPAGAVERPPGRVVSSEPERGRRFELTLGGEAR